MDSMVHEDEGLWDELNFQHTREMEQHQLLIWAERKHRLTRSTQHTLRGFVRQSTTELSRLGSIFYDAAFQAWYDVQQLRRQQQQQQQQQQLYMIQQQQQQEQNQQTQNQQTQTQQTQNQTQNQQQHTSNRILNNHNHNLDEFGLPKEDHYLTSCNGDHDDDDEYLQYTALMDGTSTTLQQQNSKQQQQRRQHRHHRSHKTDFILLDNLRFRHRHPGQDNEGWASVANLDLYFNSLYHYYYHRGLVPIVGKGIVELVTLFFTLILSVFLFLYIDWPALAKCHDEQTCETNFGAYIIQHPFSTTTTSSNHYWGLWKFLVALYCILFFAYGIVSILSFVYTIQEALFAKWVFEERLGISARKLIGGAVDWDQDVVAKLVELQQSGEYRIAIHDYGHELDALVIANRILRKENFLIALFNKGYLDLTVPVPLLQGKTFFCSSIEWSIYFCVLNFMFNHKYELRPAFYMESGALRRRFQLCGIAHLIFMPFLLFFMTLYFGLQNAYDWKSTKQYLGPREWSMNAKWTFREFNELQHLFERRLAPSYDAAEKYLALFGSSEVISTIGRIFVFMGGSLGIVLFAFAALNDAILLHVKIYDWNLLWYAGVVGALYSGGKSMIPNAAAQPKSARNLFHEIDEALAKVCDHTHHYPDIWKGRGWEQETHSAFSSMFQYKAKLFVFEIVSLILAPYILCVSLANCSDAICEFVLAIRAKIPGAGDVCGFATFDFERYADESFEGRTLGRTDPLLSMGTSSLAESILQTGNVEESIRRFPTPKTRFGKMEKSFFSFKETHPSWQCTESGKRLVDRSEQNQKLRSDALSLEQQLHREAAARQLDTLRQLEEGQRVQSDIPIEDVRDSYIPRQAPTDVGVVRRSTSSE